MSKSKQQNRKRENDPGKILAGWQVALIWVVWLAVIALVIKNTDKDSLTAKEFLAIIAGIAVTVWMKRAPTGPANIVIRKPEEVRGAFESRTNWPLVILAGAIALFGLAITVKLSQDLRSGISTWKDVMDDIFHYFIQVLIERLTGGTSGDVTETKLYIMVVCLPIGLLWLYFVMSPFLHRGKRFRVANGQLEVQSNDGWQPVDLSRYALVDADGTNVNLLEKEGSPASLAFPIDRVYSRDLGTRVETHVLVKFFREYLERNGFEVKSNAKEGMIETSFTAKPQVSSKPIAVS